MKKIFFILLFTLISFQCSNGTKYINHQSKKDISSVQIIDEGKFIKILSNGIPNHSTGVFPNKGNPNSITSQKIFRKVTKNPLFTGKKTYIQQPGIALNGILFEPGTAGCFGKKTNRQNRHLHRNSPRRNHSHNLQNECKWREEAIINNNRKLGIDRNNAHVQRNGMYHYHGIPIGLIEKLKEEKNGYIIVGYAADGHFILFDKKNKMKSSWKLKNGHRPDGPGGEYNGKYTNDFQFVFRSGQLDECNGKKINGDYFYFLTNSFPYVPRCVYGKPDNTFQIDPRRL